VLLLVIGVSKYSKLGFWQVAGVSVCGRKFCGLAEPQNFYILRKKLLRLVVLNQFYGIKTFAVDDI